MLMLGIYLSREIPREEDRPIDLGSESGKQEISLQQTNALFNVDRPHLRPN
jgi:hypothetical protein